MKPRVFIAMHYMEIGGAENSLIGLLEALNPDDVDIDLFIFSHQGVFMNAIPQYVNLLPENTAYSMLERPIMEVFKKGHLLIGLARLVAKLKCNSFYKLHPSEKDHSAGFTYIGNEVGKVLPSLRGLGIYDLAISYNYPHNIVLDKVMAKKKIAWLHTDYRNISINTELELPIWSLYDNIISISPDVTVGFLTVFPQLENKILECENIMPQKLIEKRANEFLEFKDFKKEGAYTLCSVGRISNAKNYDNIPYIAKILKQKGNDAFKFHWYIVGPGDHSEIDKLSRELGVDDVVTFLGPADNPYPYIKHCDIYVHPSRYEGKSIVVREAQILCKPVIITNYPTAKSQIKNGVDGIICELDNEKIADAIYELTYNKEKRQELISYLTTHDNARVCEVQKIYNLL